MGVPRRASLADDRLRTTRAYITSQSIKQKEVILTRHGATMDMVHVCEHVPRGVYVGV